MATHREPWESRKVDFRPSFLTPALVADIVETLHQTSHRLVAAFFRHYPPDLVKRRPPTARARLAVIQTVYPRPRR